MPECNIRLMKVTSAFVLIKDKNEGVTITNAAEHVVEFLFEKGILKEGMRLFYYDSFNDLDEIIIKDKEFLEFKNVNEEMKMEMKI